MYIFEINPLSVASFAIIFSQSEGCLFTLLTVSFVVQKTQSFIITSKDSPISFSLFKQAKKRDEIIQLLRKQREERISVRLIVRHSDKSLGGGKF